MEYGKNQESGSKPQPESQNYTKQKPRLPNKTAAPSNEKKYQLMLQESVNNLTEPSKTESPAGQQDVSIIMIIKFLQFSTSLVNLYMICFTFYQAP